MQKKYFLIGFVIILLVAGIVLNYIFSCFKKKIGFHRPQKKMNEGSEIIKLPEPRFKSKISFEETLLKRRSVRDYKDEPLNLEEISQLLWAAQGITSPEGLRTAPSAGALYPIEVYIVVGKVNDLPTGIYKYKPQTHELERISEGDERIKLSEAALGQIWVKKAPAVIVFSAVYERTTAKYGERGTKYVHMEVGHASQNVYLQAEALNLGSVTVGAFDDEEVKKIMGMPGEEKPLYIMPVGKK